MPRALFYDKEVLAVQKKIIMTETKKYQSQERDDFLGKNSSRGADRNTPEGSFHGKPPYRKRTEDLDDSL